ncbi:N-acetylmuramoyl-L-alanine amidase [Cellulosimicrobium sp. 72-3]|uniref:N-acetylmuramoyl-L-alanine amidase n=1 Tax=Cellulosimicrobium sp. 72-3 TaxID=2731680 RepID=UPI00148EB03D|nr:peptidoglycan recognition family protein [Cellulosimicrobium sp. 72-3]
MPISQNYGADRARTRAVVLHVDAGGADSLYGWFNNPAALASSHFYVKYNGVVEQYLDTSVTAWTQRSGNASCIGIETQGKGDGTWTEAQLSALAPLLKWLCQYYSLPVSDMRNSLPNSTGIGLHRYGIDPWRVSGGEVWGANGKVCPGDGRVAQLPGLLQRVRNLPPPLREWNPDEMPIIYRAGGERTPYGIFGHNGGWVELQTKAEYDNLRNAGVPVVWVERRTLDNLVRDARAN